MSKLLWIAMGLEEQLQSELDASRSAYLIQGIQASATSHATATKSLSKHLRRQAEAWIGDVANGLRKIRVIEHVKHLSAELQPYIFADGKFAMDRKIPLGSAKSAQTI